MICLKTLELRTINLVRKAEERFGIAIINRKVRKIAEDSPAEKSDLRIGDHIVSINQKIVPSSREILTVLGSSGTSVTLGVYSAR